MPVPDTAISVTHRGARPAHTGLYCVMAISFSQFVSTLGTALTSFGLTVWIFQTTKSATAVSLLAMCFMIPRACASVLAGGVVDRYGPRRAIVIGNLGALVSLIPCLLIFWEGQLKFWQVCISVTLASAWQSLLWPAVSSSVPALVREQDFVRANGALQTANAASSIIAPLIGGVVALHYDVGALLVIAILAHAVAMPTLAPTRSPRAAAADERAEPRFYLREIADAWAAIQQDAILLRLALVFAASSFVIAIATVLLKPLILSFASASALGTVLSVGGLGMLLGGLAVIALGKGANNLKQVMLLMAVAGGCMILAGSRPIVPLIAIATFVYLFTKSVVSSGVQTIIQSRVPVSLQGRMHATLAAISLGTMPLAYPLAGPLADYVFEPLIADGGLPAGNVGRVIGVGAGRGIGLLFIVLGSLIVGLSLIGQIESQKKPREANAFAASD